MENKSTKCPRFNCLQKEASDESFLPYGQEPSGRRLNKSNMNLRFISAPTSGELRSDSLDTIVWNIKEDPRGSFLYSSGGSDETRTRDLCRDRAAL